MTVRVLELRAATGQGGGPEKTISLGAARARRAQVSICYLVPRSMESFWPREYAAAHSLDYTEIAEGSGFALETWRQLRGLVASRGIQIVHAHDYKTDLLAFALARTDSVVPMSTAHGFTGHTWRERALYYPVERRLLATFSQVIAVSEEIREQLIRAGAKPERVETLLNGVDPDDFCPDAVARRGMRAELDLTDSDFALGTLGRIEPQKRIDQLIDGFCVLHRRHPTLRLVVAGDGSLRRAMIARARNAGVLEACRFLGHRDDAAQVLRALDAFVSTSDYEGSSNALLEAMATQLPVVATRVGAAPALIRHGVDGWLVPAGSAAGIRGAVTQVVMNRKLAGERARSARDRVVSRFSFDRRLERLEAIYERLA